MSNFNLEQIILRSCDAKSLSFIEEIQSLWSGYGAINRYGLEGSSHKQVVVKHVHLPDQRSHPRGWNTSLSHQRKIRSYQVESAWYQHYSAQCGHNIRVPHCFGVEAGADQCVMVLEDLDAAGFSVRKNTVTFDDMSACLRWLAHFHGRFLGTTPRGLWPTGTYWHLDTRPDELKALNDIALAEAAAAIDRELSSCPYQTLVHGDAKLANFCFSQDGVSVAAVDFQYVGGGCGMKDVAYFIGSCLDEAGCETHADELLDIYFEHFLTMMSARKMVSEAKAVEQAWRPLFPQAWADFHRFLKGWSPGHWKINSYSERVTHLVVKGLTMKASSAAD